MSKTIKYKLITGGFGPIEYTSLEDLKAKVNSLHRLFNHTKDERWNIKQVKKVTEEIFDYNSLIEEDNDNA